MHCCLCTYKINKASFFLSLSTQSKAILFMLYRMEVILLSDDEVSEDNMKENKNPKICSITCINFQCSSGVDMRLAPSFACAFYGVNAEKKKERMICEKCFNAALEHQKV